MKMVRVISSGFSTPRSRHSSGEDMIDRFAALKAISALNELDKHYDENSNEIKDRTLVIALDTDTNDSFSGVDSEEDFKGAKRATGANANQPDIVKRKQRRRERNKVSAQNYRVRRREQSAAAEKTLETLEARHKELLEAVRHLEAEKHIVEDYLKSCVKIPWCPYHHPCKPINCSPPNSNIIPQSPPNANIVPQSPPNGNIAYPSGSGSGSCDNSAAVSLLMGLRGNDNMPSGVRMTEHMPGSMSVKPGIPLSMRIGNDMSLRMSEVSPTMESSGSLVS